MQQNRRRGKIHDACFMLLVNHTQKRGLILA